MAIKFEIRWKQLTLFLESLHLARCPPTYRVDGEKDVQCKWQPIRFLVDAIVVAEVMQPKEGRVCVRQ